MVLPFYFISVIVVLGIGVVAQWWPLVWWSFALVGPVLLLGVWDSLQRPRAVLRNFPVIGHFRYLLEMVRPEINQYFIESNTDGRPFDREMRSIAYQRAKKQLQTVPFGTQRDVYAAGYEWINHSLAAHHPEGPPPRITIGGTQCAQPYSAALFNISAMSFGSLSSAAIRALNGGARLGDFYHNTGEGSISDHHLEPGGDLVWQIGTGYFGCRDRSGAFDRSCFEQRARRPTVRMIEIKLSQGAKPGHGGILPAAKITPEIARIREVELGQDVLSPPTHTAFDTPKGLLAFIGELREHSGGKPVGIKLCMGNPTEFMGLCKAMHETGQHPDFISIDGGEGGTGAAPLEFSNAVGAPLTEGLVLAHNALVGFNLRPHVKIIASGKVLTGFDIAARLAAGADLCCAARGFMFALGCIQARRCNSNVCPVGVATQNPRLVRGLFVPDKQQRVASFHRETVEAFRELLAAAGLNHPDDLGPWHIFRRVSQSDVLTYAQIYNYVEPGALLEERIAHPRFREWMSRATTEQFAVTLGSNRRGQ